MNLHQNAPSIPERAKGVAIILKHTETGRFHPVAFEEAPRSSEADPDEAVPWKSLGHHAEGFLTFEEARDSVLALAMALVGEGHWAGKEVPKMQLFLPADWTSSYVWTGRSP